MILSNTRQTIGVRKLTPIIDFNCIVDTEYGLLQLIYDKYYDLSVFNETKFKMPTSKILLELHTRKTKNPLIPFINEGISEKDADEYFEQFMNTQYEEIIDRSCGTNMQLVVSSFNDSGDISASILCHNKIEKEYISGLEEFKSNKIYMEDEFKSSSLKFNQIYFRYIDDISKYLKECIGKNLYFSSSHLNFKEVDGVIYLKDDKNLDILANYSDILIFDLYNMEYLKGETNGPADV